MPPNLLDTTSLENVEKLLGLHEKLVKELNSRAYELFKLSSLHDNYNNKYAKFEKLICRYYHFNIMSGGSTEKFSNFIIPAADLLRKDYLEYAREQRLKREKSNQEIKDKYHVEESAKLLAAEREIYLKLKAKFDP